MLAIAPLVAAGGCTCGGAHRDDPVSTSSDARTAPSTPSTEGTPNALEWDLHLQRNALVAFGNTTPLPVSSEFQEVVPALNPPLERAAGARKQLPLRIRAERDVPYGQLTRLMQAAIGYRVSEWELIAVGLDGAMQSIAVKGPGGMPRGTCWARAWVGPDQRVLVGFDARTGSFGDAAVPDAGDGIAGVLAWQQDGRLGWERVAQIVARLDPVCPEGVARIYAQPTGALGPVFDLLRGFSEYRPAPHVHTLQLAVPSLGPLDSTTEVVK